MDKAILRISKTKKGELEGNIIFEKGNSMKIPKNKYKLSESMDNNECEVKREEGQLKQVFINGEELPLQSNAECKNKNSSKNKQEVRKDNKKTLTFSKFSTAPYNFVPLNETLIESEHASAGDLNFFNTYRSDKKSGYIEVELETLTPLYIRDTEDAQNKTGDYGNNEKKNSNFFSPGNRVKIPGSSLRGMIRMLMEIVSFGKFNNFEDKLLFYRTLADQSKSVRQEYQKNMSSFNIGDYKFSAGYLKKEGLKYYIIPAQKDKDNKQCSQVFKTDSDKQFTFKKRADGKYCVVPGIMSKKRKWLINPPDYNKKFEILEKDVIAFANDENRYEDKKDKKYDGNLLRMLKTASDGIVPCFYVKWKDFEKQDRVSFGHTGYFRLAYNKTIGDHVPGFLKDSEKLDLVEAIFGSSSTFSSRVFFEDAELLPDQHDIFMQEASPKILSSPKPTTFQHYLEQTSDNKDRLNHWNSNANIRGYKLYWHKVNQDWHEKQIKNDSQHTIIRPVKPQVKFKGRIRFENLSQTELGVLLFALNLPKNHYHKLGMGKPLGLGSIKITSKLYIVDRLERYQRLFNIDKNGWHTAVKEGDKALYINNFQDYVLSRLSAEEKNNAKLLWEVPRLKNLKVMLDWENTKKQNWLDKTCYMELQEFKRRLVLQRPLDV